MYPSTPFIGSTIKKYGSDHPMEKCFDAHCDAFDSAPEELKNEIKLPRSIKTAVAAWKLPRALKFGTR
jgi:hypothetical protein